MITAVILPSHQIEDETVDQIVMRAISSGLVACNAMTGPFRICFFPRNRVPKGWARMGMIDKTPEAA
jgi:hypothetical protein